MFPFNVKYISEPTLESYGRIDTMPHMSHPRAIAAAANLGGNP
jgi:hypothetical protein